MIKRMAAQIPTCYLRVVGPLNKIAPPPRGLFPHLHTIPTSRSYCRV